MSDSTEPLPPEFYRRGTVRVARELLGKILIRKIGRSRLAGLIVETEAYTGKGDPASHAARGATPRSKIMFGPPGKAYVYFCYGNHHLLNVVTEKEGVAGAVLLRALEARAGLKRMMKNRGMDTRKGLLDGPGKLTQALEIDLKLNGRDLTRAGKLYITEGTSISRRAIKRSPRIGIREGKDKLWRFTL